MLTIPQDISTTGRAARQQEATSSQDSDNLAVFLEENTSFPLIPCDTVYPGLRSTYANDFNQTLCSICVPET